MTDDTRTQHEVIADRVAMMRGRRQAAIASKPNYQMYGVIAAIGVAIALYVAIIFGGDTGEASNNYRPQNALTLDDSPDRSGSSSLFGDTTIVREPEKPDPEMMLLREQVDALKKELKDAMAESKKTNDVEPQIPEAYQRELDRMNAAVIEMRENYDNQIASYRTYIEGLEQQFKDANRLPPRPVTLNDDKWLRAQQITESNDNGKAARLAAPSMVFDARSTKEQEEKEENIEAIEQMFGNSFPDNAEITPPPSQ